jgi:hypothetical protein
MTITLQFVRYTSDRQPVIVDAVSFPFDQVEQAKTKAQSVIDGRDFDPRVEAARIVDQSGMELYSFNRSPPDLKAGSAPAT